MENHVSWNLTDCIQDTDEEAKNDSFCEKIETKNQSKQVSIG